MKSNRGFAIIETIIVVVMMTTSLLLVYNIYNASITNEKKRIYYDDVVDVYKISEIKNYILEYSQMDTYLNSLSENTLLVSIGIQTENETVFFDYTYLKALLSFYNIESMMILRTDYEIISSCTYDIIYSSQAYTDEDSVEYICKKAFGNYSYDLVDYVKSLGSNADFEGTDFILIGIFKNGESSEKNTYAYIELGSVI